MGTNFLRMRWSKRSVIVFLLRISYFSGFLKEMTGMPCETPLGIHKRPSNSRLTFEIVVTSDNLPSFSLKAPLAAKHQHDAIEKEYIQISASETVLLTGLILEGDEKSQSHMTSWTLGLSEDCQLYTEENYSIPEENRNDATTNNIKVSLHYLSFARCIRLIPIHFKGGLSSLRFDFLGCGIGSEYKLCKDDFPESEGVSQTVESSSSFNFNQTFYPEESSEIETLNSTEEKNDDDLLKEKEQLDINEIYSLFESNNASSEDDSFQTEMQRNTTNDKILRENGLFQEDTILRNETEKSPLNSDVILNDNFDVLIEELHFLEGNDSMENGSSIDILSAYKNECGIRPFLGKYLRKKRVVLGHQSTPGEWPWSASLHFLPETRFTTLSGFKHLCGASLISSQWLVTAAHCFSNNVFDGLENLTEWRVYLGLHDQAMNEESDSVQIRNISFIVSHSQRGKGFESDIALIKLDKPVEFSESVRPICLDDTEIFFENAICYASGWGQRTTDSPGTRFPYTAALSIMTLKECETTYADLPDDHGFKEYVRTEEDMVCAYGPGGEDTCQGDSGGGLMCTIDNKWHLVGITSGGFECGRKNFPAFYTRVSFYKKWIEMNLEAYDKY